jgi:hypothetical protein
LPEFMRHVLETTTVNLTSSVAENGQLAGLDHFTLPLTFFFNSDALLNTVGLQDQGRLEQFCACRKAISVIMRF